MERTIPVEMIDPRILVPHPVNEKTYGDAEHDAPIEALIESIREHGIIVPLIVAADKRRLVAGHRRRRAAIELGLPEVRCEVHDLTDDLEIEQALLESNRQREKTHSQIGREAQRLFALREERAKRRQVSGLKQGTASPVTTPAVEREKGEVAVQVGRDLGCGPEKARNYRDTANAIARARSAGDNRTADKIEQVQNERGPKPAAELAKELAKPQRRNFLPKTSQGSRADAKRKEEKPGKLLRLAIADFDAGIRKLRAAKELLPALQEELSEAIESYAIPKEWAEAIAEELRRGDREPTEKAVRRKLKAAKKMHVVLANMVRKVEMMPDIPKGLTRASYDFINDSHKKLYQCERELSA